MLCFYMNVVYSRAKVHREGKSLKIAAPTLLFWLGSAGIFAWKKNVALAKGALIDGNLFNGYGVFVIAGVTFVGYSGVAYTPNK